MLLELAPLFVLAWLITYLVHSTVLLSLAWLLARRSRRLSLATRERVWKLAVAGGFLTATLQVGLGLEPPLGRLALTSEARSVLVEETHARTGGPDTATLAQRPAPRLVAGPARGALRPQRASSPTPPGQRTLADQPTQARELFDPPAAVVEQSRPVETHPVLAAAALPSSVAWPLRAGLGLAATMLDSATEPAPATEAKVAIESPAASDRGRPLTSTGSPVLGAVVPEGWSLVAMAGWGLAGLACVCLFVLGLRRLRRDLRDRVELVEGPVLAEVERLRLRAGVARAVRVWVAPRLAAPLSMGWVRPALCVPPRALEELEPDECSAMLAHEVAHLARRDPLWLFALWLAETVFFFQPLNRLARRELAATFELAADTWAARATGERLALASCLARIAAWIVGEQPPRAHRAWTAAMADALDAHRPRSRLGERIERLLDEGALDEPTRPRGLEASLGFALLTGLVLLAPGAAAAFEERAPEPPAPPPLEPVAPAVEPPSMPSPFATLDTEMVELVSELTALREELAAVGLESRYDEVLRELEQRARHLAERRARIQALLERARALEAGVPAALTPWQDETLPTGKD